MLIFTKLTDIYDHIHAWYWYLCTILVFTYDTGIYACVHSSNADIDIDFNSYPWLVLCNQIAISSLIKTISNIQSVESEVVESVV